MTSKVGSLGAALASAVCVLALVGCEANDAISATNGMPARMDQTNSQLTAASKKMDVTIENMESIKSSAHKQTLAVSLDDMLKAENTKYLSPPTSMLPFAQAFADAATALEVVKLAYVYFKEIETVMPDESDKWSGDALTPPFIAAFDHSKQVKFTAIQLIAALLTQDKVEEIARTQIESPGRYEDAALAVLMLREAFIENVLIDQDLFGTDLDNLGKLEEAAKRVGEVDWIANRPYVSRIAFKTTRMLDHDHDIDLRVDPASVRLLWRRLDGALRTELDPAKLKATPNASEREAALRFLIRPHSLD